MKFLFVLSLITVNILGLQAQDPKELHRPFSEYIVPMNLESRGSSADGIVFRIWSLRDGRWYEFEDNNGHFLEDNGSACMFKGEPVIKQGEVKDFQIAFGSPYEGKFQVVMERVPGKMNSVEKETVYYDDDVEIVWELRSSPGIEIINWPTPPNHPVRWKEPVLAPFRICAKEIKIGQQLNLYLYINAYHKNKLIGYSEHVYTINPSGYESNRELPKAWSQCHGKWTSDDIAQQKKYAAGVPRLHPLKPGQSLNNSHDIDRQQSK